MFGRENRKVRLYLQDGPTIEGVLVGRTRHDLIVWAPKVIANEGDGGTVAVSGHVEIPRDRVVWKQVLG